VLYVVVSHFRKRVNAGNKDGVETEMSEEYSLYVYVGNFSGVCCE